MEQINKKKAPTYWKRFDFKVKKDYDDVEQLVRSGCDVFFHSDETNELFTLGDPVEFDMSVKHNLSVDYAYIQVAGTSDLVQDVIDVEFEDITNEEEEPCCFANSFIKDKCDDDSALDEQIGGTHYKDVTIQPVEYIERNNLGFCAGNVVKYVTRYKQKGGKEDLMKARHYIDLMLELEYGED